MSATGARPSRLVPVPLRAQTLGFGRAVDICWRILRGVPSGKMRRYFAEALRQAAILTTGSVLIVLGLVLAFGFIVGTEGTYAARLVGAPAVAGAFSAIGDLREVVPFSFGFMMAAKVSTGFVAEIGTMRITQEVDALDVMGLDSVVYLGSTRLLGMWMILPFVYAIAIVVAFVGSYIVAVLQIGQVSPGGYFALFWKFQSISDYLFSVIKGMSMATFVVLVGCYFGYTVSGGPVEVGRATAKAMIVNLVGVNFIGIMCSQLFWGGGTGRFPIGG
jgi:phospholipid/cholesterol/gamma-HCH transport system permease protein